MKQSKPAVGRAVGPLDANALPATTVLPGGVSSPTTSPASASTPAPAITPAELMKHKAVFAASPIFNAALLLHDFCSGQQEKPTHLSLIEEVADGVEDIRDGKMGRAEAMLYAQALALQSIFVDSARRAAACDNLGRMELLMRMALKAQGQCRMTLETLAVLKNPPVFARQANVAYGGPQQVNNGQAPLASAPAANSPIAKTEVFAGEPHAQNVDARAARSSGRADPPVAAVGAVDRTTDRGRQAPRRQERLARRRVEGPAGTRA